MDDTGLLVTVRWVLSLSASKKFALTVLLSFAWTTLASPPVSARIVPDPLDAPVSPSYSEQDLPGMALVSPDSPLYLIHFNVSLARESLERATLTQTTAALILFEEQERLEEAMFSLTAAQARADHAAKVSHQWTVDLLLSQESLNRGLADMLAFYPRDPSVSQDMSMWVEQISEYRQAAHASLVAEVDVYDDLLKTAKVRYAMAQDRMAEASATAAMAVLAVQEAQNTLDDLLGQKMSYYTVVAADGCPVEVPPGTLREYSGTVWGLCARSVAQAPTPQAALAIKYAFRALGADYACDSVGRYASFSYDCSSLVVRSYSAGGGVPGLDVNSPLSTRQMVPWGGGELASWLTPVAEESVLPGDLVLYDTFKEDTRHVVLMLADGMMLHADNCGDVVHIRKFWGFENSHFYDYLGSRRVTPQPDLLSGVPNGG